MPYTSEGIGFSGAETSRAAASLIAGSAATLREKIMEALSLFPDGLTCDELEDLTEMKHQTCSARVRELLDRETIYDTGLRRPTRNGRAARVYRFTKKETSS